MEVMSKMGKAKEKELSLMKLFVINQAKQSLTEEALIKYRQSLPGQSVSFIFNS